LAATELKRETFNKVVEWLRDYGYPIEILSNTELYAKVFPPLQEHPGAFFYIAFSDKSNDSFSIGSDIVLIGEYKNAIDALQVRAQDQVFMDIRKLVYPLGINLDTKYPKISLHKLIFFDSLRDKQYYFDSVQNLIHAMLLILIRLDELRP
jgi:hypothetical protein